MATVFVCLARACAQPNLGGAPLSFEGPPVSGGLGASPFSLNGPPSRPASQLLSGGLLGQASGSVGGAPGKLPTLNLLGGAMGGASPGLQQAGQTPQDIQQMQVQAIRDPRLDSVCPGKQRQSRDVGKECWATIWTEGGCKRENVPEYEQWHQTQSMEVLVADVVQWANLPDTRHKQGCYGDAGPPVNEPPPPSSPGGGMGMVGMGGMGGMGLGGGAGLGGSFGGLGGGGGRAGMGSQPEPQGPPPPPEVMQRVQSALESPALASLCPGVDRQSTAVGEPCWKKIWTHVGCLADTVPPYEQWHATQNFEILVADAAQWASLPSEKHKKACYGGGRAEL